MRRTPFFLSSAGDTFLRTLKSGMEYWPVACLLLSFYFSFDRLMYGTLVVGFGLLWTLFQNRKDLLRSHIYMLRKIDVFIAICISLELLSYTQSSFEFNSRPYLHLVLHAVLVYYFIRNALDSVKLIRGLCLSLAVIGIYYAVLTMQRAYSMMAFISDHGFTDLGQFRNAYSPLVASNEWTLFLLLLLPFTMALALSSGSRVLKGAAAVVFLMLAYGILLGFSRGGYIALLLFMIVVLAGITLVCRRLLPSYITGLILGACVLSAAISPVWPTVKTTILMNENISQQRSTESRWRMWNVAKSALKSDPVFGVGAYNYAFKYNTDHLREVDEAPMGRVASVFVQLITEKGMIGVLIPFLLLLYIFISGLRFLRRQGDGEFMRLLMISSLASAIAVCVRELTVSTLLFRPFIFHLFTIVFALLISMSDKQWKEIRISRSRLVLFLIPGILLAGAVTWHTVSRHLILRQRDATQQAMKSNAFDRVVVHAENLLKFLPDHPIPHVQIAAALARCPGQDTVSWENIFGCNGNREGALQHLSLAATLEPRDETIEFARGWIHASLSEWEEALRHFNNAYATDPTVSDYPLAMAIVNEKAGHQSASVEYYTKALSLNPTLYLSPFFRELKFRNPGIEKLLLNEAVAEFGGTPGEPISAGRRGALHYFQGNFTSARKDMHQAIEGLPGMNRPYYYIGAMALSEGDTSATYTYWDKSVTLDPNDQLVNWKFGVLLYNTDPVRAKSLLSRATSVRFSEQVSQKRRIFYPEMPPYSNTVLSEALIQTLYPEVDMQEIDSLLQELR